MYPLLPSYVLRHAARRGWYDVPCFERPRVCKPQTRWLTHDEADRLIAVCAPHLQPLVVFLLNTGCRIGEALRLQWTDVDLHSRTARFLRTKNGESRGVPLNDCRMAGIGQSAAPRGARVPDAGRHTLLRQ
jgi:integrase